MTTTRRALRAELTQLGERPIDGPSLAFRNRLERQLTGTADTDGAATLVPLPRRHRRLVPIMSAAAAIAAAVVLTGALLGAFGSGGSGLQLGNAHDTTVRLPDGRVVSGRTGLGLPNGSVVQTGPNGRAAAGSVELGPGLQGVVDNNRIVLQSVQTLPAVTLPPVITVPKIPPATLPAVPAPTVPPLGLGH